MLEIMRPEFDKALPEKRHFFRLLVTSHHFLSAVPIRAMVVSFSATDWVVACLERQQGRGSRVTGGLSMFLSQHLGSYHRAASGARLHIG